MNLSNIYIVLDHPDECRNIGSACRAMANNDITHLRIVGKKEDYDTEKVHVLAIHAAYIYDNAEFFDSITQATADCTIAAGTTRRRGKYRKGKLLLPEEFASIADVQTGVSSMGDQTGVSSAGEKSDTPLVNGQSGVSYGDMKNCETSAGEQSKDFSAEKQSEDSSAGEKSGRLEQSKGAKVAVVFGNERTGLTDSQLKECTLGVTIPSSQTFASLNLSHAVQIISYHLFRTNLGKITGYTPLPLTRIDKTVTIIAENLKKIGFFSITGREDMENFWRSLLSRAALSESEAKYLEKIFCKAAGMLGKEKE